MSSVQGQSDNKDFRRLLFADILRIVGVAVLLGGAILGALLLSPPLRYVALAGLALILALYIISQPCTFLFRKSQAGVTLLNLGDQNKVSGWQIAGTVLIGIFWLMLPLITISYDPTLKIAQFGLGVFYIAGAASKLIASREPTLITEKGIYGPEGIMLWDTIESWQWLDQHEHTSLTLKLKNRSWLLGKKVLHIPVSLKADVDKILWGKVLS